MLEPWDPLEAGSFHREALVNHGRGGKSAEAGGGGVGETDWLERR